MYTLLMMLNFTLQVQIPTGAWFPLAFGAFVLFISYVWHYGATQRFAYSKRRRLKLASLVRPDPRRSITAASCIPGKSIIQNGCTSEPQYYILTECKAQTQLGLHKKTSWRTRYQTQALNPFLAHAAKLLASKGMFNRSCL